MGVVERMWHSLCAMDYLIGMLDKRACDCDAPPAVRGAIHGADTARGVQEAADVLDTGVLKQVDASLHLDRLLYAHATLRLHAVLQAMREGAGVDLLRCF